MSVADRMRASTYQGRPMGDSPLLYGELRRSDDVLHDTDALSARMAEDGYLYLPGLLDREETLEARAEIMRRLGSRGVLDPAHPTIDGVARAAADIPKGTGSFMPLIAQHNAPLEKVLYAGRMMAFYERFLGGPVRHYDYTWFRVKLPGTNGPTTPHYDVVYMGRGTRNLFTSWVPFGDVPVEMGGLLLLENSHRLADLKATYGQSDVDLYCENVKEGRALVEAARREGRDLTGDERGRIRWDSSGAYSSDAIAVRQEFGLRWLTADYELGDVLVFSMYTMHCSHDNRTGFVRVSSDSRYQLAAEPVDDRWIGEDPPAHGIRAKRGMIC